MNKNLSERTLKFGVDIVKFVRSASKDLSANIILNQLLRSGTSIGANYEEAQNASSRADFIYKVCVALKEARETLYWIKIISAAKIMQMPTLAPLLNESEELIKILTSIAKKSKMKKDK